MKVWDLRFRVKGPKSKVQGFKVQGLGFRVEADRWGFDVSGKGQCNPES